MALAPDQIVELADRLWNAERSRVGIPPLSQTHPELTVADAYRVQQHNVERRLSAGEKVVGRKIGLTSLAMQHMLGVDQPDYGAITDALVIESGGELVFSDYVAPKLEPEFAFRLARGLTTAPSPDEVRAAIGEVCISLEVIDSRIADWRIALVDTIADNASCARIVCGPWREATAELLDGLPGTTVSLTRDDEVLDSGEGSAVLGDPLVAVHWLATALGRLGQSLNDGDVVLAGSVCGAVGVSAADAGSRWEARTDGFAPAAATIR